MIKWLKNHFVPHHGNRHRPHFLHGKNTRAILALVLCLELLVFVLPTITFVDRATNTNMAAVLAGVLASLTNDERRNNDLPELVVSPILSQAAELKARDMAEKGYFAHTSPEGKTPWYWLDQVGYQYDYAGENLAINFVDSEDVTDAWMQSPTHRANIVKSAYKEVGTGIATGMYEGRETVFVAQVYANPRTTQTSSNAGTDAESTETTRVETVTPSEVVTVVETPEVTQETAEIAIAPSDVTAVPEVEILGAEVSDQSPIESVVEAEVEPNSFEKATASPRHSTSVILYAILGIVVLALLLNVLIKINVQHPDLITNGLFLVTVIVAILIVNNYIGTKNLSISQGTDYSREQVIDQEQTG